MSTSAGLLVALVMLASGLVCELLCRCNEQVKGVGYRTVRTGAGVLVGQRCARVEAPLGAGFGVAARPGGGVDGEYGRPRGWAVRYQQVAHLLVVDASQGQRFVQAAMAATEGRFQAQRGYRAGRCPRTQGCVAQFERRVGPAGQASVEACAKAT